MSSDRYPLSFNQDFLLLFDQGDDAGPFGPKYNLSFACRVTGPLRAPELRGALRDVVERHSALRTVIVREDPGYQKVLPAGPVSLIERDFSGTPEAERSLRAEKLILEVEAGSYPATLPLLRAVLGRFDDEDAVLVLIAHHTAADEWSMPLIVRDVAAFYAARVAGVAPDLPPAPQFVDYAAWDKERASGGAAQKSLAYWRQKLDGAQALPTRTDHLRSAGLPKATAWDRFTIPARLSHTVGEVSRTLRCSPFMVLLAAYKVYLHEQTGETDIVVMSFASGRGVGAYHETVGSFFNFIPLRTNLSGCTSFREVATRVRRTCLEAYRHEVPFLQLLGEAPDILAASTADDAANCAFQVFRSPLEAAFEAGDVTFTHIRDRELEQNSGGDVPDGGMWHLELDLDGDMPGCFVYNTNLFTAEHVADIVSGYVDTLERTLNAVDSSLDIAA
jgi:condensation enzyme